MIFQFLHTIETMAIASIVAVVIATVAFQVIIVAGGEFLPVYHAALNEYRLDQGRLVYIPPPSSETSCTVLCALSADCRWAVYIQETHTCVVSGTSCPQLIEDPHSRVVAVQKNMVCIIIMGH